MARIDDTSAAQETLRRMGNAIRHRGPDADGQWLDADMGVGLVHRRLSILDLSAAGAQPMKSRSGRYVLVFNGEIYNHKLIRAELAASDPQLWFQGHSDTEVMLAAFERWGVEGALKRFNGMFAFGLVDRQERQLFLARDRVGEKPLYVARMNRAILFGSELSALSPHPAWRGDINIDLIPTYLRYGYIPAPYSIFTSVSKVMPGRCIRMDLTGNGGKSDEFVYWSATDVVGQGLANPLRLTDEQAREQLEALLDDAVHLRMESDVPLGAFLSGGIDSSLVVALMQRRSSVPVKTFSIGFNEARFNEADSALAVARHLGTAHTELYITPEHAISAVPRLPLVFDEPFADSSQLPTLLVAELARQKVTVALSGDGGDELFGGYVRYPLTLATWKSMSICPRAGRRLVAAAVHAIPVSLLNRMGGWLPQRLSAGRAGDRLHKLAERFGLASFDEVHESLLAQWHDPGVVMATGVCANEPVLHPEVIGATTDQMDRMMAWDLSIYLPDDILTKVDRATMAVSLEGRIPLLDHRLIEFAWRLPQNFKRRSGTGKWLLREVLFRLVPRELVDRPKAGFGAPVEYWLRAELRDWANDLLSADQLRRDQFFDPRVVGRMLHEHGTGQRSWASQLWALLMFQAWRDNLAKSTFRDGP